MIQLISVTNNFLKTHRIQSLTFLKNKIKSSETFQKSSNFSQKYLVKKKLSDDTSRLQNNSKFEVAFKGLAFWSSLFFIFFFLSNPSLSKINRVSNAVSANFSKKSVSQKLSQVPVFAVTNATGQPYLANNSNGEQIGLIFFSKEDALMMLKSMQKTHQALEARIYIMGLDKAYRMVTSNASPSGIQGNLGQELKMIFRFYPDQKQIKHANTLKNFNPIESFKGVPVFIADGLTIRKGKEEIVPVFLTKEDLEKSWSTMCKHNPDQPLKPKILISSLLELIPKMEKNPEDYVSFGFFPPSDSVEFVKRENQNNPSARIMTGVFQKI